MKVFLAAVLLIGIGVLGMCVTIIFKKGGKFPDGEISTNKELRKKGIICAKEEEMKLWGKKGKNGKKPAASCTEPTGEGCSDCSYYCKGN